MDEDLECLVRMECFKEGMRKISIEFKNAQFAQCRMSVNGGREMGLLFKDGGRLSRVAKIKSLLSHGMPLQIFRPWDPVWSVSRFHHDPEACFP